jgi:hypothetical protein
MVAAKAEERGIIDNQTGCVMADSFAKLRHNGKDKTIGLLVGKLECTLAGMPIHQEFHICSTAFEQPKRTRRSAGPTQQDREGLHTFRRGDLVEYKKLEAGELQQSLAVYGVVYAEPVPSDNQVNPSPNPITLAHTALHKLP